MKTIRTIAELRAELADARHGGRRVGLVPTMGAFHAGHLSLIERARHTCEVVVVSLFVNPTQFDDERDLSAYPRVQARDAALAEEAGVDFLFAPSVEEMYPSGFATTVSVKGLTETLEGARRGPAHFDAVATVVTKLLNIATPEVAFFGQKDAQQALVVRRLVRDLDISVQIEVCPIVRDADGLALSSRNVRLGAEDRARAAALHRALAAVRKSITAGEEDPAAAVAHGRAELAAARLEPEYLELVSPQTLEPLARIDGDALAVVAVRVGDTRLIDNQIINRNGRP
jgi:pantoate--beta-alanine ligase